MGKIDLKQTQNVKRARSFHRVFLLTAFLALSACGKIKGTIQNLHGDANTNDFLKTEIISGTHGIADGTTEMLIAIHLKNSDSTSVRDYQPTYSVTSGTGVTAGNCSTSDSNGIAACVLRSNQAGTKTIRLTNARVGLEKSLVFDPSLRSGRVLELAAAGKQSMTTTAGHKMELTVGQAAKGLEAKTASGYRILFSAQGAFSSR
jgi:hypothetical protein